VTLTQKTCIPCQSDIPPLTADEAAGYLAQVSGWALSENTDRISRKFEFADFKAAMAFVHGVGDIAPTRSRGCTKTTLLWRPR